MNDLWNVISNFGFVLHPDRIEYMAKKIADISSPSELLNPRFRQGLNVNPQMLLQLKNAWENTSTISPREVAAALKSASVTSLNSIPRQGVVELVWPGGFDSVLFP